MSYQVRYMDNVHLDVDNLLHEFDLLTVPVCKFTKLVMRLD